MFFLVVVTAGLADEQLTVETLTSDVDEELEGLETANTMRLDEAALVPQQLSLGVLSFNLGLQLSGR